VTAVSSSRVVGAEHHEQYELFEEALDIAVEDRIDAAAIGSGTGTLSALTDVGAPELCHITDLRLAASGGGGGPWSGTRS
jgi:hypothetical protein